MKRTRYAILAVLLLVSSAMLVRASLPQVATGTWQAGAAMSEARTGAAMASLPSGQVLMAGGTTAGGGITNSAEMFDPASNSWSGMASVMQDPRSGHSASALVDGRVLLAGGENSGGVIGTLEVYDPAADSFSSVGTLMQARKNHGAAVLKDGRVWLVGGSDGTNALASSEIYDPADGSVTAGPNLPQARSGLSATTLLDGTVLIAGGSNSNQGADQGDLASTLIYDPTAGTMTPGASLSAARSGHTAILLPNNNEVLIAGGSAAGADLASAELYIPWTSAVQATAAMSAARNGAAGSGFKDYDGRAMVAGGSGLASSEYYGFATVKTDKPDYSVGEIVTITGQGWQPGESVTLNIHEIPFINNDKTFVATADAFGNIVNTDYSPELTDIGFHYFLTATGASSQAQNTFTDAADPTSTGVSCNPNPVAVSSSSSCTATVTNTKGGSNNGPPLGTVAFTRTGAAGTFTGSPCTLSAIALSNPPASSCSVTFNATAAGTANITGTYTSSNTSNSGWQNSSNSGTPLALGVYGTATKVVFIQQPTSAVAGTSIAPAITVQVQDVNGTLVANSSASISIAISTNPGSGTLSGTLTRSAVSGVATFNDLSIDKAANGYRLTASSSGLTPTPASNLFNITAGSATKLVITGSGTQTAGTSQNLTITAQDNLGNTDTTYTTNHNLTFSGANSSTNPVTAPTVVDRNGTATNFGNVGSYAFTSGVATVAAVKNGVMTLYKAETAVVSVTDGSISSSGADNLTVVVSVAGLGKFALALASPQTNGAAFTGSNTLTAQDNFGNTITTFDASADNVTITANAPLTGAVSGLGSLSNNVLNQAANFTSGVANLTALGMKYTGNAGTGTFTALSGSGKSGTSGNVTINAGTATKYLVTSSDNSPVAGTAVTITAQLADANNNPVSTAGKTVTWSKTGAGGSFGSPTSLTNGSGVATVSFTTSTVAGTVYTVTATDNTAVTGTSGTITTVAGALHHFAFATISSPQTTSVGFNVTITAQDVNNNTVTSFDGNGFKVNLSSTGTLVFTNPSAAFTSGVLTTSVTISNAGNFTITATGLGGNSGITGVSNSFDVVAPCTATAVTTNPISQTVTYGVASVSFTAAASGNPAPTVLWEVSTNGGGSWSSTGVTTTTLTINIPSVSASGNQYRAVFTNTCGGTQTATSTAATLTVNKAHLTVTANDQSRAYAASDPTFTSVISGFVNGQNLGTSGVTGAASCSTTAIATSPASPPTYPINCTIGSLTASNYDFPTFTPGALTITKASSSTVVTGGTFTFDNSPHAATVSVTGAGGLSLSPTPTYSGGCSVAPTHVSETTPTACTASYSYAGDANHDPSNGSATIVINKATSSTVVTGGTFTFDNSPHAATVSVTGVGGLSQTPPPSYSGGCTVAPTHVSETTPTACTASYSFAGDGDHDTSSGSATISITPATSTTTVSFVGSPSVVFDGASHAASVHVSGVGLSLTPAPNYTGACSAAPTHVAETPCTASYTFAGDGDHAGSSGTDSLTITQAPTTTVVTAADATYDGSPHGGTASVTGVGGLSQVLPIKYIGRNTTVYGPSNTAPTDAGDYTAQARYVGDADHSTSNATQNYTINKAASSTAVHFAGSPSVVFDGDPHPATVHVTGAGGLDTHPAPVYGGACSAAPVHVAETPCTASYHYAGDNNHLSSDGNDSLTITKAPSSTVVSGGGSFQFDGSAHGATVSVTGAGGLSLTPDPLYSCGATAPVHVAQTPCTASYDYAGDADHDPSGGSAIITITKAPSSTVVSGGGSFQFDGAAHGATVSVTGAGGLSLTPDPLYSCGLTAPVHVAQTPCTASYSYAGDADHDPSSGSAIITITKAPSSTVVSGGGTFQFDGLAHAATVSVTGAGGLSLAPDPLYSCGLTAPVHVAQTPCTASYDYAGDADHDPSSGSAIITITKAPSSTVVSGGGTFQFDGSAHGATVAVTGAGGLSLTPDPLYSCGLTAPVHVAQTPCTASFHYGGDPDHDPSDGSAIITITKAPSSTVVSGGGSFVFDGLAHGATVSVTGAGGLNLAPLPSYTCGTAPIHVADTPCTASYSYAGDPDHDPSSGSAIITITKAPSVTTIGVGYTVIYNALPHGVTANVTGAGGLSQAVAVVYNPGGSTVPVNPGIYTATATFAGDADHTGSSAGPVTINITFGACSSGQGGVILPPINSDGTSVYSRKGGSTIPVKFTVCDAFGQPISNPAAVFGPGGEVTMLSQMRGTVTIVNEDGTNDIPDVAFSFTGGQWHFNMATMNLAATTTYTFRINLAYAPSSIIFKVGVK